MKSLGALLCLSTEEKLESSHGTEWTLEKQNNNWTMVCDHYFGVVGFWIYAKEHRSLITWWMLFFGVGVYAGR